MFSSLGIKDIIDILLVAVLLYEAYKLMKRTGAIRIFFGIIIFILVWFLVSYVFRMELFGTILDQFVSVGAIALIVIFQNEIRRFFLNVGEGKALKRIKKRLRLHDSKESSFPITPIVMACQNMSKEKVGALIVIERTQKLWEYTELGETINANVSEQLIESLFFKNSPLHDGAIIIAEGRIASARCILPVSQNVEVPNQFGLRHRAAIGVTEKTDALAIVVSEETGDITICTQGKWIHQVTVEKLNKYLYSKLGNK